MKRVCLQNNVCMNFHTKRYSSLVSDLVGIGKNEFYEVPYKQNINSTNFTKLICKNSYNTYRNKVFSPGIYNNVPQNYMNMQMNNNENNLNNMPNNMNYKYDNIPNSYYQSKYNTCVNNENSDNNPAMTSANTTYQYFSIFGSTAMCLIKPIYPDCIVNKNKVTIYGKGGFQFIFMKKQNNSNKYDKNNKMSIFLKINSLSNILSLKDIEKLKTPICVKGNNNNCLFIDKHKEKKDHIVIKYKYQPSNNTDNNFGEVNNLDMEVNESTHINNLNDDKKNNFEELHVSSPFSEFLLFQNAANLLLPQLIGWAKQH
ncbi:hypothetical protein, conserved [Plasmodium gonderi]|uniref:Uncharacterized protein n=1 Tax=Plasmodium gonderi TaxID=77519 RepID=A0A1Y1JLV0_PLAGO|nr:hypothetical protein, conserved [Plasmodium gonderi]GAW81353.1 hypothetical protein, conserved [Plasmodium gonderi]